LFRENVDNSGRLALAILTAQPKVQMKITKPKCRRQKLNRLALNNRGTHTSHAYLKVHEHPN
jgi:hypothetical protein